MDATNVARYIQDGPLMLQQHTEDTWLIGLFRLLMLAIVVAGVVWVAKILVQRSSVSSAQTEVAHPEPLDIAKERFAKGEITKEELDEIRKELSK